MSALGQKRTYALQQPMSALPPIATAKANSRKRSFRFIPKADMCSAKCNVCFTPIADIGRLFDHLVGDGEQLVRHGEAERLRRLHVQRHLELDRQLNRKLRWIGATENPIDVGRGAANYIAHVRSIRQEAAVLDIEGVAIHSGHVVPRRQRNDRRPMVDRKDTRRHDEPAARLAAEPGYDGFDIRVAMNDR